MPALGRYLNRELSTLQFHERILAQAEDETSPLLERTKFAAIFAGALDEFYQVRVAGLKRQVAAGTLVTSPDGLTAALRWNPPADRFVGDVCRERCRPLLMRATRPLYENHQTTD